MGSIRQTVTNHSYEGWTKDMREEEEAFILAQEKAEAEYEQAQIELEERLADEQEAAREEAEARELELLAVHEGILSAAEEVEE